ncbi:hypothetical protein [Aeoliella mucimassa]|uniref:Uncharacterized protein n=1 Tax=Aeoliella mucimassa TaxID=2527972 RepID=A0A518AGQ5_9BACT|nr:hypothetical protein [Aeoliella mucimassa]QDU53897.1 hypothetical protein Pan181_00750 [Aeoliella mucimassa]
MPSSPSIQRARGYFIAVILLGLCVVLVGPLWTRALAAVSVDAILTPSELQDPQLVEAVNRAQNYKLSSAGLLVPYYVLGAVLMVCGTLGCLALNSQEPRSE